MRIRPVLALITVLALLTVPHLWVAGVYGGLLGCTIGIDPGKLAIKLPGVGRIGLL